MNSAVRSALALSLMLGVWSAPSVSSDQLDPTPGDLLFSAELRLPGYEGAEFGRLEYPAIAIDRGRKFLYIAYDYTDSASREGVFLNSLNLGMLRTERTPDTTRREFLRMINDPDWSPTLQVSSTRGEEYAPSIAVSPKGIVCIAWSARRNNRWEVYARMFSQGVMEEELRLTNNDDYDFRPQVFIDSREKVWIVWERGTKDKHITIVGKSFVNGTWSEEFAIEDRPGYSYRPVVAEGRGNTVWFAWDHGTGGEHRRLHPRL